MNKKETKYDRKVTKNNYRIDQSSSEIPSLLIQFTVSSGDFITKNITLSSSSWNMRDCVAGLDALIERYENLQEKKLLKD